MEIDDAFEVIWLLNSFVVEYLLRRDILITRPLVYTSHLFSFEIKKNLDYENDNIEN